MDITCTKENLQRGISIVARGVDRKSHLPILESILVAAKDGSINLTATNLEVGLRVKMRGKIDEEGVCAIQSKMLSEYIPLVPSEQIQVLHLNDQVQCRSGDYIAELGSLNADDFPVFPQMNPSMTIKLPGKDLKHALVSVLFAAAEDETRPEISGIFMTVDGDTICFVATDGYRLAEYAVKGDVDGEDISAIIPIKTAAELARMLSGDEDEVTIQIGEGQIRVVYTDSVAVNNEVEMISKLTDGKYPDYNAIIPQKFITTAEVVKSDFQSSLKAASLFSKTETKEVRVQVDSPEGIINLLAESSGVGKHDAKVQGKIEGEQVERSFNCQFVLDGLKGFDSKDVMVSFSDDSGPTLVSAKGDEMYRYVIMPLDT